MTTETAHLKRLNAVSSRSWSTTVRCRTAIDTLPQMVYGALFSVRRDDYLAIDGL